MHVIVFWLAMQPMLLLVTAASLVLIFVAEAPEVWITVLVAAASATLVLRGVKGLRVGVKTGRVFGLCCGRRKLVLPVCDLRGLMELLRRYVPRDTERLRTIGSGWGFFIKRGWTQAPRDFNLYTHDFRGQISSAGDDDGLWRAGTTVRDLHVYLARSGLVLPSQPTMADITVGSWIAAGNHGNGGDASGGSSKVFAEIHVVNIRQLNAAPKVMTYKEARFLFDKMPQAKFCCVVAVRLAPTLPRDEDLHQQGLFIPVRDRSVGAEAKVRRWLADGAVLRVLFVGGAKTHATGIRWQREPTGIFLKEHRNPHCCSRCARYCQADICSVACGCDCGDKEASYAAVELYSAANEWTPPMLPIYLLSTLCAGIYNCEFIFKWPDIDRFCHGLLMKLHDLHRRHGGRSELRYSGANKSVFLDVAMGKRHFGKVAAILHSYKITDVALHAGKYDAADQVREQLRIKDLYDIYYEPSSKLVF